MTRLGRLVSQSTREMYAGLNILMGLGMLTAFMVACTSSHRAGNTQGTGGAQGSGGIPGTGGSGTVCGLGSGRYRGRSTQTVMAAGVSRSFVLFAGADLDPKKPVPLVVVAHRLYGSGENMRYVTGYDQIAERDGFVAAFPDALSGTGTWNVGHGVCEIDGWLPVTQGDIDQPFLNELIELINGDQCIDRNHIFITGLSMGGYFTNETACVNPAFRAAGPHSAGTHDLGNCAPRHVPIIIFHSSNDTAIHYSCGIDARDRWIAHNGCSLTEPEVTAVKGGTCEYYKNCPVDGQVAMCTFVVPTIPATDGGFSGRSAGHGWSGGAPDDFSFPETESASELGWAFFRRYAW
jgi:polyhydroxybutyrate depolymerase